MSGIEPQQTSNDPIRRKRIFFKRDLFGKNKVLEALPESKKYVKIEGTNLKSMKLTRRSTYVVTLLGVLALWSCGPSAKKDDKSKEFDEAGKPIVRAPWP